MKLPPLSERDFMKQITDLAELRGFEWVHCRAGRTMDSWRTPMSGTMAQGWPDLCLMRAKDRRLIFAEVKTDVGKLTAEQERVLGQLDELTWPSPGRRPQIEVVVWRPRFWDHIERTLA